MSRRTALAFAGAAVAIGSKSQMRAAAATETDPHQGWLEDMRAKENAWEPLKDAADRLALKSQHEDPSNVKLAKMAEAAEADADELHNEIEALRSLIFRTPATTPAGTLVRARLFSETIKEFGGFCSDESCVDAAGNFVAELEQLIDNSGPPAAAIAVAA